ncbi:MAG: IS630 family transposase [Syntrophaceae bacterium]|nr:IS630 family transposase [Syntrophaceae bacterium]
MLTSAQYTRILSLDNQGHSVRNIRKLYGYSRNTIRKVLNIKIPPSFKTPFRPSKLDEYKGFVKDKFNNTIKGLQIYEGIVKDGYDGSYSTVRRYLSELAKEKEQISNESSRTKQKRNEYNAGWALTLLQGKMSLDEIEARFEEHIDIESIKILYNYVIENSLRYRNRSITIFAHMNKIPERTIAEILGVQRNTVRSYVRQFKSGGTKELFDFSRKETKIYEEQEYRDKVFYILHSPPSCFDFNRTTWRMEDLHKTMATEGFALSKPNIRKIIKKEGYRFLKARKVLTSNDPLYRDKLKEITAILSNLKPKEKFFSIDEFGPLAIKMHGGRSWTPPGNHKIIPQWQTSKGSLIVTAALELSTNQVTHFYSPKKNTDEMIKLLEILLKQYKDEERIFFSWDAASWHASKKIYMKVDEVNGDSYREIHKTPIVTLAPLPSCAQFLNVIESIFSGMAKAIIHNSNYVSVEECMIAVDRYFSERNQYFTDNFKRAGNKIWGKETTKAEFSESNNCKNSRYMN